MSEQLLEELKACPFCGGECTKGQDQGSDYETYWRWWIECNECGATVEAATEDEVIAKWEARQACAERKDKDYQEMLLEYADYKIQAKKEIAALRGFVYHTYIHTTAVGGELSIGSFKHFNLIDEDGNPTPLLTGESK